MVLNLKYASESCWKEVCKKVGDSVVFVDGPSAEALSWHGGVARLAKHGAVAVKEFSSFENGGDLSKAVFLVSSPVVGPTRMVLRDLISNSTFNHCVLIMSCSPIVLNVATAGNVPELVREMTAVRKLEVDMTRWMKADSSTAEIFHFSFTTVPITDYFFTLPAFRNFFPCFSEDLEGKTIYTTVPQNLDMEALPLELQICVLHIMTSISGILSQLSAQESIYSMGLISSLVGSQLQKHTPSALRLQTATNKMSLILIDRNLDLCETMYQNNEVVLDKMKAIMDPFPGHSIDIAIDMSPICRLPNTTRQLNAYGCLHDPQSDLFEHLISKKRSEILSSLLQRLDPKSEEVSLENLRVLFDDYKGKHSKILSDLSDLQLAIGFVETFDSKEINSLEVVESLKKLLYQSISADNNTDNALIQLKEVIISRKRRGLNIQHILSLLIFMYSLIGQQFEIDPALEKDIQETIFKAIEKDKEKIGPISSHFESYDKSEITNFLKKFYKKLNSVKNSRKHFSKYSELAANHGRSQPLEYRSLISQLMYDLTDINKPEIPDLKYKANVSMRDNLASRFSSMLLNTAKPHVMDNETIMVFVIGGVTAQEVRFIKETLKGKEVIVGSTSLVSPAQIMDNLLFTDPLKPFGI